MKIKTKLLIGLCMMLILTFILIAIGWYQLSISKKMADDLNVNYEISSLSYQIQRKLKDEAISLRNIISFNDNDLVQKEVESLQRLSESIIQDIQLLESMINDTKQQETIDNLKSTNQKFNDYMWETVRLNNEGKNEEAVHLVMNNGYQMQDAYFKIISNITAGFEADMNSTLHVMETDFREQLFAGSFLSLLGIIAFLSVVLRNMWTIAMRLNRMSGVMLQVANGNAGLNTRIEVKSNDEMDIVAQSFNHMAESLEEQLRKEQNLSKQNQEYAWTKSNLAEITSELSGMHELELISQTFLQKVTPLIEACQAALYFKQVDRGSNAAAYRLHAAYAYNENKPLSDCFSLGEGLVGQAALENKPIILKEVPADYVRIRSAFGEAAPLTVYVWPVSFKGEVLAVLEVSSFTPFTPIQQSLLEESMSNLGVILDSTIGRIELARLLEESQVLMEEVQAQSEELQAQQEELRTTNEELEAQTIALRQSEETLQFQQEELEHTNSELRGKAEILEIQNRKFETKNKEVERARAELEEKAVQLALSSKYKSEFLANMSHELRTPLNSLLILSKLLFDNPGGNLTDKQVEFSKTIYSSGCDLLTIINDILDLAKVESGKMEVDPGRVYIEDLASFTEKSFRPIALDKKIDFRIKLKEGLPHFINSDEKRLQQVLKNLLSNAFKFTEQGEIVFEIGLINESSHRIYFAVTDTGIGIPKEKQALIFEAFQQADGTTSRKYGGTGLGLSICREISALLGGEIMVESEEGKGSTFTFLVGDHQGAEEVASFRDEAAASIETTGQESMENPLRSDGAVTELHPPLHSDSNRKIMKLLIVDDDLNQRNSLMELIGNKDVIITAVSTGAEALEELKVNQFDCMVLDLGLSDTTGFELLERMEVNKCNEQIKIFIYTGRDLTSHEELYLKKAAHTIIIKDSHSPQRLMDELEMFLGHSNGDSDPIKSIFERDKSVDDLEGKKVLLVDDDVRNVFAITNVLEMYGMSVKFAENGKEGLRVLQEEGDFDIILMDIMMPEMDGYEAMQRLRKKPEYDSVPVIALTAKAMKEDREKCIEAGASDYIVKPVDSDQLISLIRVWLYPEGTVR